MAKSKAVEPPMARCVCPNCGGAWSAALKAITQNADGWKCPYCWMPVTIRQISVDLVLTNKILVQGD